MSEFKIHIEADSFKELLNDIIETLEDMGSLVIKGNSDLPENLETFLKGRGVTLFRAGEGVPKELLKALLEENQEEVLDFLLENKEATNRLVELLQNQGYNLIPDKDQETS